MCIRDRLTPHASKNLGREGDRRIDGRTRSQARAIGQQQLSPLPEDAASTPLPQLSSSDDHNQGLLSFARRDVLLSMLATHNVVDCEREMRGVSEPGELGDGASSSRGLGAWRSAIGRSRMMIPAEGSMGTGTGYPARLGVVFRLVS